MRKIAIWTVGAVLLLISGIFYSPAGATPLVGALSKLAITSSHTHASGGRMRQRIRRCPVL